MSDFALYSIRSGILSHCSNFIHSSVCLEMTLTFINYAEYTHDCVDMNGRLIAIVTSKVHNAQKVEVTDSRKPAYIYSHQALRLRVSRQLVYGHFF